MPDISALSLDKKAPCATAGFTCDAGADWSASIRGRVGYAVDNVLLYGTGGAAWLDYKGYTIGAGPKFSDSRSMVGWTVDGGIEWAFTPKFIARAEYLYADYGKHTMHYNVNYPVHPKVQTFRLGVSYKF